MCSGIPPGAGLVPHPLNEIAGQSGVGIRMKEQDIPVKDAVRGMCELLGFDPLYIANEGKLLAIVAPEDTEAVLAAMRQNVSGREAIVIGEVTKEDPGRGVSGNHHRRVPPGGYAGGGAVAPYLLMPEFKRLDSRVKWV